MEAELEKMRRTGSVVIYSLADSADGAFWKLVVGVNPEHVLADRSGTEPRYHVVSGSELVECVRQAHDFHRWVTTKGAGLVMVK